MPRPPAFTPHVCWTCLAKSRRKVACECEMLRASDWCWRQVDWHVLVEGRQVGAGLSPQLHTPGRERLRSRCPPRPPDASSGGASEPAAKRPRSPAPPAHFVRHRAKWSAHMRRHTKWACHLRVAFVRHRAKLRRRYYYYDQYYYHHHHHPHPHPHHRAQPARVAV